MKIPKKIKKLYYIHELRQFDRSDVYAHIGHEARDKEEFDAIKKRLDEKRARIVRNIKRNS